MEFQCHFYGMQRKSLSVFVIFRPRQTIFYLMPIFSLYFTKENDRIAMDLGRSYFVGGKSNYFWLWEND